MDLKLIYWRIKYSFGLSLNRFAVKLLRISDRINGSETILVSKGSIVYQEVR